MRERDLREVRAAHDLGFTVREIAWLLDMPKSTVQDAVERIKRTSASDDARLASGPQPTQERDMDMQARLVTITPKMATELLQFNTNNRPLNMKHVRFLAREIEEDRWKVNGETIKKNGVRILDGQHRLHAIVLANRAVQTWMVEGIDSDAFPTVDTGKRRTAADVLAMSGAENAKGVAAAVRLVDDYSEGRLTDTVSKGSEFSNQEILDLVPKYPGVDRSVRYTRGIGGLRGLVAPSVIDACHYLFAQRDPEGADTFVRQLFTGDGIASGDPVHMLRERLMKDRIGKSRMGKLYSMALVIKSWNARRQGRAPKYLRMIEAGKGSEAFPVIV